MLALVLSVLDAPGGHGNVPTAAAACHNAPLLVSDQTVRGETLRGSDVFHASCAREALSGDRVYLLRVTVPSRVALEMAADFDSALYVRGVCTDAVTELACNDDGPDDRHSSLDLDLAPGDYWVFVDGYDIDSDGTFALVATVTPHEAPSN